jgi:U32 family peptidase
MTFPTRTAVELLAPAGDARALRAALAAGADAVYFGLERWSARSLADNFAGEAAVHAVELAHLYDANAYLALNTLLKDDEVEPALAALEAPYRAGLDALIVADVGFAVRVRDEYPDLPLHASTQLGTHSSAQLAALARIGFARAILARELSLAEIGALDRQSLELEAFVHGALCYGYSGDCLFASMVGGRSGNRGRCSQPCRLRYSLRRLGDPVGGASPVARAAEPTRVMSTSDLAAIGVLPQLIDAGVTSFKIEGRMKDAAYVGVTTAVYREAMDSALADPEGYEVRPGWMSRLEQSYSRGFTTAHLEGRHHEVRGAGRGGHRGVVVGRVARVDESRGEVEVRLSRRVAAGDLVYLYTPWGQSETMRLTEGGDANLTLRVRERVAVKDRLFRLSAAGVDELTQDLVTGRTSLRPIALRMRLMGEEGGPAELTVEAGSAAGSSVACLDRMHVDQGGAGVAVAVVSRKPLTKARSVALTEPKARAALEALGGTPYRLHELELSVADGLFLAVGELKDMRRRAVAALDERRLAARRRSPRSGRSLRPPLSDTAGRSRSQRTVASPTVGASPQASAPEAAFGSVLILRPGEAPLLASGVEALCLDVLRTDSLETVVAGADQLRTTGLPLRVRMPEILFDSDDVWWRSVLSLPWQGVYVRHLGVLCTLDQWSAPSSPPFILEYPLQGLNSLVAGAAAELAGRSPAAVVASPEATLAEIGDLASRLAADPRLGAPPLVEVLAFGRQQVLHSRDSLGAAEALYDALRPAEHVSLLLEDAKGYRFPADVDVGGTRLYNARVTNTAANLDELRAAGVSGFLVIQSDLDSEERSAFAGGGLRMLAPFVSRRRSTSGHLFRGVS